MPSRLRSDAAAVLLACLIGALCAEYHHRSHFDPHVVYDGFNLPGFDAHVYLAMAEEPRFFTVGPWGYRILLPGLLGAVLPPRLIVPGFEWAAKASLVLASGFLFAYLRILGATSRASLLAVFVVMLTPSVDTVFGNVFLVEPFALILLLLALIAIEGDASDWIIALGLLLLSLSKEIWVFLLPLVFVQGGSAGVKGAALRALRIGAPSIWVALALRWIWTPQGGGTSAPTDYWGALGSIASNVALFAPQFLLGGLTLAAIFALRAETARDYLHRHALTLPPLLALPLAAAAYTGEGAATSFFADDVRRLLIYALPFIAALAVQLDPAHGQPFALPSGAPRLGAAARALVLALLIAPLAFDRYSRVDLSVSRDGPYTLGFVRETLRTARRLDRGETVRFDPTERKFAWGVSPPRDLDQLRFFLGRGFGPLPHYGIHDIRMRETSAVLVAPTLAARPLTIALTVDARESAWMTFHAGGSKVGEALIGPQAVRVVFEIPEAKLFRGDNPVELRCEKGTSALPRLRLIEFSQARGSS